MKFAIYLIEIDAASHCFLGQVELNTADAAVFSVMPWPPDSDHPSVPIPDGYHMIGFRFFSVENSITVYLGKGKLVSNE
jgi:hypothetical protein